MREKIARFMQGRYGVDQFSNFLVMAAVVLMVLEMFIRIPLVRMIFNTVTLVLIVYAYVRILSKNINKRYAENETFMRYYGRFKNFAARKKAHMVQRRTHHIYKCPNCKQSIRVPKGKGRIASTCPRCKTEFIKRS